MTGEQFVITILGLAIIVGSSIAYKWWLSYQAANRDIDFKIKMTEEETKRHKILADLVKDDPRLKEAKQELDEANSALLKRLDEKDSLSKDGVMLLNGEQAKQLVAKIPEEPIDIRLDGNYIILNVQSGAVKSGYKATIQSIDDDEKLSIDIPEGTLTTEQIDALKEGEWAKKQVFMEINAKKRGNKILKATLSQAGLKPSK